MSGKGSGGGSFDFFFIVLIGLVVAIGLLLAASMQTKWTVFIIMGISALLVILIFPDREKIFLYASVLFLPMKLDFHFIFIRPMLYRPVNGLVITAFDLPFAVLMVIWVFRLLTEPEMKLRFYPWISLPFLFMLLIAILDLGKNSAPPVVKYMTLWVMFQNLLVFLYIANNVRDRNTIFALVGMLMVTLLGEAVLGLAQRFTGGLLGAGLFGEKQTSFASARVGFGLISRVGGTLGHPNRLAAFFGLLLPLAFAMMVSPVTNRTKFTLMVITVLAGVADIFTLSRGGWLGLSVGGTATLFLILSRWTKSKFASLVMVSVVVIGAFLIAVVFIEPVQRRIFEADYGAAQTRLPLMQVAENVIVHNPFTGVGLGDYANKAVNYDNTKEAIYSQFPHPVHNAFLLIAGELGIPSLVAFSAILMIFLGRLLWLGRQQTDPLMPFVAYGLFGGLVAWIVHHQIDWEYILLITRYWFLFGMVQAMYDQTRQAVGELPAETAAELSDGAAG